MITERVIEFLRQLLERHNIMAIDLKTILDKLTDQGATIAAQGVQIDKLLAAQNAQEAADLAKINDLIDANGKASDANAAKLVAAVSPASGDAPAASSTSTVTVASPSTAPASVITVTGDVSTGSTISGDGVSATAVDTAEGPVAGQTTVTLSEPTTADHVGDGTEALSVTPPAAVN